VNAPDAPTAGPAGPIEAGLTPDPTKGSLPMLIAMILLSVAVAAVAQLALKHGMNRVNDQIAPATFSVNGASLRAVSTEPYVWAGLALFGLSALVWLVVLSRASLSFAYPFAALTYILILVFDRFALQEQVPPLRYAGVAFIAVGIFLISRTPHGG
jgi:drug/metabolite transporter (DMT)-like permease